ncbi:hypothetical protein CHUAL_008272 [Chamberlinius hualienensis]
MRFFVGFVVVLAIVQVVFCDDLENDNSLNFDFRQVTGGGTANPTTPPMTSLFDSILKPIEAVINQVFGIIRTLSG